MQIHDHSLTWLGTGTSIKSAWIKLVLSPSFILSEIVRSCKCYPHMNKMPTLRYNRVNNVIIKNGIILNIKLYIFNGLLAQKLSYVLKRVNGRNHYLNI